MQLSRLRPLNLSSFIFYHKYKGVCVFLFVRFIFGSKHCTRWNTIQPNLWQVIFSLRTLPIQARSQDFEREVLFLRRGAPPKIFSYINYSLGRVNWIQTTANGYSRLHTVHATRKLPVLLQSSTLVTAICGVKSSQYINFWRLQADRWVAWAVRMNPPNPPCLRACYRQQLSNLWYGLNKILAPGSNLCV